MPRKSAPAGFSTIVVGNANAGRIKEALRLLDMIEKHGGMQRIRKALKWLCVTERFVRSGGRFKKRYKRKVKKTPAGKK